jgi:hypothetical protein
MTSPLKRDSQPMQAVLTPCDNICRLLTPPAGGRELSVKNLLQVLPAIAEGASRAVTAWERYTRHIDGSAYKMALRVAHVVLGTMTQAVQACRQVEARINTHDDDTADDGDNALSASGDGFTAAIDAQRHIIAHSVALLTSVSRTRLTALRPAAEQLRSEVDRLRDTLDVDNIKDAAAHGARHLGATWPLQAAVAEAQRAMLLDTFKVPPSVHEVLGVAEEVGSAIRGPAPPKKDAEPEEDPDDPVAAIRASFRAALAENSPGPSPPPHGKGFAMLLSRPLDVPGAHDLTRSWVQARNALAEAVRCPAMEVELPPAQWSTIAAEREAPGDASRGLTAAQQILLGTVVNHLHTAVGRYPANMTACYAMAVLLCDGALFFEPFVHPAGQLPAAGVENTSPSDGRHRCVPFVQPERTGGHFPDCALDNIGQAYAVLGIGTDKMMVELSRIAKEARGGYEAPPLTGGPEDEHQTSGGLLTILCSAAQPLLMIFSKYPTSTTPSLMELFVTLLGHLVGRFAAEWAVLRMKGTFDAAVARDETLFRRFFANHPTLTGSPTSDEGRRRVRLFDVAGWN